MKAVRLSGYNAAPTVEDIPAPQLGPGEVLIHVAAAALNPLDVKLRDGKMKDFFPLSFPYTVGTDLAGTVASFGGGVGEWAIGDRAVVRLDPVRGGALAKMAVAPAEQLVRVPDAIPLDEIAGAPTTGGTAWQALFEEGRLERGQTILVHAGAGGLGSMAVQFARRAGARVIATASGSAIATVRRLGADQVIDYRDDDFARRLSDLDFVLDTVGGETQQRSFQVLRAGGTLVSTVQPPDPSLAKAHRVRASFIAHQSDAKRLAKVVDEIVEGAEVLIDVTGPLDDVPALFNHQASGHARGKIIVRF